MTGTELKRLRQQAGLTQTELGSAIGTTYPIISKWETDKHKISKAYQKILTAYFKV